MISKQFLITGNDLGNNRWIVFGCFPFTIGLSLIRHFHSWKIYLAIGQQAVRLDPEFYYALVTMHGTILVFFVLTAGLSGTFANFLNSIADWCKRYGFAIA